jgi:protein-S-isoprenylcysteine O-methyltransferase Ste14
MNFKLILKSILITISMPGVGIILLPYLILKASGGFNWPAISIVNIIAFIFGLFSLFLLLQCIWGFAAYGKGTLAPIDPPKHLVVGGFYKYTRNPMYLGVIGVLVSEAVLFRSMDILIYLFIYGIIFNLLVIFYEEPKLRAQFGESYKEYCQGVPRWLITFKRFKN